MLCHRHLSIGSPILVSHTVNSEHVKDLTIQMDTSTMAIPPLEEILLNYNIKGCTEKYFQCKDVYTI